MDNSVSACTISSDYIIYKTINSINKKIYVGQKYVHTQDFYRYLGSGKHIKFAIKKYGRENFSREIIEYCTSANKGEREIFWIAELSATNPLIGYNLSKGGQYSSEEQRIKISKINRGKILSEEHKRKISESNKGKTISEEQKIKIGNANRGENNGMYGIPCLEKTKIILSKVHTGHKRNRKYEYILNNNQNFYKLFSLAQRQYISNRFKYHNTNIIQYKGIEIKRELIK